MTKISSLILTKNEEKNIVDCMESLAWCDEIVVVDDFSEDRTEELAKKIGARVYRRALSGDFSSQRNYGILKCENEWIFSVDADERVSEKLKDEIQTRVESVIEENGFSVKRCDELWGKKLMYGETGNAKFIRLAKKNSGKWLGKVHEKWKIDGRVGELKNPLSHFPHQKISEFITEINFYSDIRARELSELGVKVNTVEIFSYPLGKFLVNYFIKLGFLDGIPGLIIANMMSLHSFLVRGKLWLLNQQGKQR